MYELYWVLKDIAFPSDFCKVFDIVLQYILIS